MTKLSFLFNSDLIFSSSFTLNELICSVPCCRPQNFQTAPEMADKSVPSMTNTNTETVDQSSQEERGLPEKSTYHIPSAPSKEEEQMVCLDLGSDMPSDMNDVVASLALQKKLNRCHAEGFIDAVREHVSGLARCNSIRKG